MSTPKTTTALVLFTMLFGGSAFATEYIGFDGSAQECTGCYCSVDQYGNEVVLNDDGSFHAHVAVAPDGQCNCVDTQNGAVFVPDEPLYERDGARAERSF